MINEKDINNYEKIAVQLDAITKYKVRENKHQLSLIQGYILANGLPAYGASVLEGIRQNREDTESLMQEHTQLATAFNQTMAYKKEIEADAELPGSSFPIARALFREKYKFDFRLPQISGFHKKMLSDARKDILSIAKTHNVTLESAQRLYQDETGAKLPFPDVVPKVVSLYSLKSKVLPWREKRTSVAIAPRTPLGELQSASTQGTKVTVGFDVKR